MSEDLEFNPFYQALQRRFLLQYEQAQQNCWLVCIPRAASLSGCSISKQFVDKHLLQPSPFLRDHYESTVNNQKVTWQLNDRSLEIINNSGIKMSVRVLGEELAYNKSLKQFRMFILDRPLDPNYKPRNSSIGTSEIVVMPRTTFRENKELLESFLNHTEVLANLDARIATFERNYLIVEVESLLHDTAQKLEIIAQQASSNFVEVNRRDTRMQDRRVQEAVRQAIESYLMHKVHSKVYPAVCKVLSREDRTFSEHCRRLRGCLTPSTVGVPEDYSCQYSLTLAALRRIEQLSSPLEKLYCLQDAMDSVIHDAKNHFTQTLRLGEPRPLPSDDLIVLLATIIVQSDCAHFPSSLYYMEHFHWSLTDANKLSYVLVTFRAAVEYLRGPETESFLPKEKEKRKTPEVVYELEKEKVKEEEEGSSDDHGTSSPPTHTSSLSSALLASMGATRGQQETTSRRKQTERKANKELGPFLSLLMESDDTVTSSSFYASRD